jgi:hypothetical protein
MEIPVMKKITLIFALLFSALTARGNTVALDFTGADSGALLAGITYGWAFTLSGAVLVTDLGLWDENSDGLQYEHTITIWDNTTMAVMAQATVSNLGTTLVDGFRYVSLASSVLLLAGEYTIGGYNPPPDFSAELLRQNAATITTASGVTYNGSRSVGGDFFPAGDIFQGHPNSYFGPNFQFTPVRSVPDAGSTLMLLASSAVAIFGLNLLQRKTR